MSTPTPDITLQPPTGIMIGPTPSFIKGRYVIDVKLFDNDGKGPYTSSPADFILKEGDVVIFSLTSESEYHTFTIEDTRLDVDVESGEITIVSRAFNEPGTYRLVCIVHEFNGMVGTITVTDE